MRNRIRGLLILSALAGVFYVASRHHGEEEVHAAPMQERPQTAAARLDKPGPAVGSSPTNRPSTATLMAMRKRFEDAQNYAAFIHDSMQRPTEGGRFYATLAHHRCADIASADMNDGEAIEHTLSAAEAAQRARAVKIIGDFKQRCSGVMAQFPDAIAFTRAITNANTREPRDELYAVTREVFASTTYSKPAVLKAARELGDRYLLAVVVEATVDRDAEKIDAAYARAEDRTTLYIAVGAAACEIAGNCRDNIHVLTQCIAGGDCMQDDYGAYLRSSISPESLPLFDKTKRALLKEAGIYSGT